MKRHQHRYPLRLELLERRDLLSVVSGSVFEDLNDNAERDTGEPGRDGWEVRLLNSFGDVVGTTTTTNGGQYGFLDVAPGQYVIQETVQAGWRLTYPSGAALATSQQEDASTSKHADLQNDCGCDGHHEAKSTPARPTVGSSAPISVASSGDLLPDLAVDIENGIGDWHIDGNELRFSQASPNLGDGPMELRGGDVQPNGTQEVFQRIRNSDGSHRDRTAGFFVFHPEHGHIHFEGYSTYNLRQSLPDSNGDGIPEVGDIVATGGKISFCLLDVDVYDDTLPNFDPAGRFHNCGQTQGISVGWEDVYDSSLEGQLIDITNVLPGRYWLEAIVDPENRLVEKDETNNVGRVLITLPHTGRPGTYTVDVAADQDRNDLDFGNFQYVTLSGVVFEDHDGDGAQDLEDQGLSDRLVYLDRNGNDRFDDGQVVFASTDVPRKIPDEGLTTSTLAVAGTGLIADLNVQLSIDHDYAGDLRVFIIGPQGTRVELVRNRGSNGKDFDGTVFDDEGTQAIGDGAAPFHGRFRPESPLTAFDGLDADGLWTLEVRDTTGGDVGTLVDWSLKITFEEPHVHTDAAGQFAFDTLGLGTHRVRQVVPKGWTQTTPGPDDFVADQSGASLTGVVFGTYNAPPQVVNVQVKPAGKQLVSIPVGSGAQLDPLLVGDIMKVVLTFSQDVAIKRADLNLGHVKSFRYDAATLTGMWILEQPLHPGQVELNLSDRVKDRTGLALDGEWDNPTDVDDAVSDTFASGDGVAGGRFVFRFVVGPAGAMAAALDKAELAALLFAEKLPRKVAPPFAGIAP